MSDISRYPASDLISLIEYVTWCAIEICWSLEKKKFKFIYAKLMETI